jgi:hypothetical protein
MRGSIRCVDTGYSAALSKPRGAYAMLLEIREVVDLLRKRLGGASGVLALTVTAQAALLLAPGDYSAIQEAIVAAEDGDAILVAAGTYGENLDFLGEAIEVRGKGPW